MKKSSFNIIDAHAHLQHERFDDIRGQLIQKLKEKQIGVITVGTDLADSSKAASLAKDNEHIWAIVGMHPYEAGTAFDTDEFSELVAQESVVGVGECGLDYYRTKENKDEQKELFKIQLQFASEHNLPVMLHCRPSEGSMDAYEEALDLIDAHLDLERGKSGDVHFFVGNKDIADAFLTRGFTLSFTGIITHDRSLDHIIEEIPSDAYLIETDAPYAAPEPHRGKRNSPEYVSFIAKQIAELRGLDADTVRAEAASNTAAVFDILS